MSIHLHAQSYEFDVDVDGISKRFHVGIVCREQATPTSIHFNEQPELPGHTDRRATLAVHLPQNLWKPAKDGGLETVCRKAISLAMNKGWFRLVGDHNAYEFDEDIACWPGKLSLID